MSKTSNEQAMDLAKYMESEFGITPNNIDEKLKELKKKFYERRSPGYEKCEGVQ